MRVHTYMRWANDIGSFVGNDTITASNAGNAFTLSQLPNATEFTNLYDRYKIVRVYYRYVLSRSPDFATTTANRGLYPRVTFTPDYDGTFPATVQEFRQYPACREFHFSDDRPHTRWYSMCPAIQSTAFNTTLTSCFMPKWMQWVDTVYPDAPHFGLSTRVDQLFAGMTVTIQAKFLVQCAGVR